MQLFHCSSRTDLSCWKVARVYEQPPKHISIAIVTLMQTYVLKMQLLQTSAKHLHCWLTAFYYFNIKCVMLSRSTSQSKLFSLVSKQKTTPTTWTWTYKDSSSFKKCLITPNILLMNWHAPKTCTYLFISISSSKEILTKSRTLRLDSPDAVSQCQ